MIEEYDEIREVTNPAKKEDLSELTKLQTEYLKELNIPSDVWEGMSKEAQSQQLGFILERFNEIDIFQQIDREAIFSEIYSSKIVEAYKLLEAPQDYIKNGHMLFARSEEELLRDFI